MSNTIRLTFQILALASMAQAWVGVPSATTATTTRPIHDRRRGGPTRKPPRVVLGAAADAMTESSTQEKETSFTPIFDFTKKETIDQVARLDDAIMGGISTSSFQPADGFARWGGVCRTDGGGFCGFRTNPFEEPLMPGDSDGLYMKCRLTSDDEPERRVWKMSTRTKPGRGELLYQALLDFTSKDSEHWTTVKVPFDTFRYVRGPRMIPDGPPLDASAGLYQIGMTMSKFAFGVNTTLLENFREGFFELQIKEIGLYKEKNETEDAFSSASAVTAPRVFSKLETKRKRPLAMKLLFALAKILFSEKSQRRKSAMRILRQKRKLSRMQAIWWGFRNRAASFGVIPSLFKTLSILLVDAFRATLSTIVKVTLMYPIRFFRGNGERLNI